jgi:hypothetical protein
MYSFAQRADALVYDEPLYAHYLSNIPLEHKDRHPEADSVLATMDNNGDSVVEMMMGDFEEGKKVVFFKNMTHHLLGLNRGFMDDVVNVVLTRDPVDMLPSFAQVIDDPSIEDVGYAAHLELVEYLSARGKAPVVLDSRRILENPDGELRKLCEAAGIDFDPAMLRWEAGARKEDGVWAKHWYAATHRSTGFQKYSPKEAPFPEKLKPLLEKCKPCYEKLLELA